MGITSALVLFFVIWFLVFLVVIPIRLETQGDVGEVEPGTHKNEVFLRRGGFASRPLRDRAAGLYENFLEFNGTIFSTSFHTLGQDSYVM